MFTKTTLALAIVLGTASGALAGLKDYDFSASESAAAVCGTYRGTDPAARILFNRDCEILRANRNMRSD
jgi:hypothetical protein